MKRKWTRGEKLLWATPTLVGLLAVAALYGPQLAGRALDGPNVWRVADGTLIRSMALSANGEILAAAGSINKPEGWAPGSGTITLWNARTGEELPPIAPVYTRDKTGFTNGFDIYALKLSPDAETIGFSRVGENWALYDTATRKLLWRFPHDAGEAEFSADGSSIALSGADFVWIVNASNGKARTQWKRDGANFSAIAWSPDGKWVANIAGINIWNTPGFGVNEAVELRRAGDGKLVYRLPSGRVIKTESVQSVAFSPDNKRLMTTSHLPTFSGGDLTQFAPLRCHEVATGKLLWQIKLPALGGAKDTSHASFCDAIFSPDGRTVAVYQFYPDRILFLDSATGTIKSTRSVAALRGFRIVVPPGLLFAPDGKRLFVRGGDAVLVWDLD